MVFFTKVFDFFELSTQIETTGLESFLHNVSVKFAYTKSFDSRTRQFFDFLTVLTIGSIKWTGFKEPTFITGFAQFG